MKTEDGRPPRRTPAAEAYGVGLDKPLAADGRRKKSLDIDEVIADYVPVAAMEYCRELIGRYNFRFILRKERQTKLGDFRSDKHKNYTITVNHNLNPYQFLVTFIHEFAHLEVAVEQPKSVKAHGNEWKQSFKNLMLPVLRSEIFPDDILRPLARHMRNPKAAASSDPALWRALQEYNGNSRGTTLADIQENDRFIFKNRLFVKQHKRRTRVLCLEVRNGKQYLIPEIAEVERVE